MCALDHRKSVLYLGIDPKHFHTDKKVIHLPLISIVPRSCDSPDIRATFEGIDAFTHIIFTSKSSVKIFFAHLRAYRGMNKIKNKYIIAIGGLVAQYLKEEGVIPTYIAGDETEEGITRILASLELEGANILLPKSSAPRPHLIHFLVERGIRHHVAVLYDMFENIPEKLPSLENVDEIVFTIPMAVRVFFSLYENVPTHIRLHAIGYGARESLHEQLAELSEKIRDDLAHI